MHHEIDTVGEKIYCFDRNGKRCEGSLFKALGLAAFSKEEGRAGIVSVVGAGGKTTLIRKLQEECLAENISHIITTTTHMQLGPKEYFVGEADIAKIENTLQKKKSVWMGIPVGDGKMGSFPFFFLENVEKIGAWMFLEADGAKRLPVKAPRETEPVILKDTTHVVCVYGLDGIGRKIKECSLRPEYVCKILGKSSEDELQWEDIVTLALSPEGGRKSVTERMDYQVVLNKADTTERLEIAERIARKMLEEEKDASLKAVHVTCFAACDRIE